MGEYNVAQLNRTANNTKQFVFLLVYTLATIVITEGRERGKKEIN